MTTPAPTYVSPEELRKALKLRDTSDPRLERVCQSVSDAFDWFTGRWDMTANVPLRMDPVPPGVAEIALSWAVDLWKQPDAGFGIVGMAETGPVRIPRAIYARFVEQAAPYTVAWGIA